MTQLNPICRARKFRGVFLCCVGLACTPTARTAGSTLASGGAQDLRNPPSRQHHTQNSPKETPPPPGPSAEFPATQRRCFRLRFGGEFCAESRPDLANFTVVVNADFAARPEELLLLKHMLLSAAEPLAQAPSSPLCEASLLCLRATKSTIARTLAALKSSLSSERQAPFYRGRTVALEELAQVIETPLFKLASAAAALHTDSAELKELARSNEQSNQRWTRHLDRQTGRPYLNRLTFRQMSELKRQILRRASIRVLGPATTRKLTGGFVPAIPGENDAKTSPPAEAPGTTALRVIDLPGDNDWSHGILSVASGPGDNVNNLRVVLQVALNRWMTRHPRDVRVRLQPKTSFVRLAALMASGSNELVHDALRELARELTLLESKAGGPSQEEILAACAQLGLRAQPPLSGRQWFQEILRNPAQRASVVWGHRAEPSPLP